MPFVYNGEVEEWMSDAEAAAFLKSNPQIAAMNPDLAGMLTQTATPIPTPASIAPVAAATPQPTAAFDPLSVVRNAGLESIFAPQIIDENNNMSAGYTPSFNAQGYLIDPRAGTAANSAPAGTPYYKQGPNGNALMLDQSGQWVDSGQPFNDVDAGSGGFGGLLKLAAEFAAKSAAGAGMAAGLGSLANALDLATATQVAAETGSTVQEVVQVAASNGVPVAPEVEQALVQGFNAGATTAQTPGFTQLAGATQSIPQLPMDYGIDFGAVTMPGAATGGATGALSNITGNPALSAGTPTLGTGAATAPTLTVGNVLTGAGTAAAVAGLGGGAGTGITPPSGALGENLPNLNTGSTTYPQLGLDLNSVSGPGFQLPATTTIGQTVLPNIIPPGTVVPNTVAQPTTGADVITPGSLPNIITPQPNSTVTNPAVTPPAAPPPPNITPPPNDPSLGDPTQPNDWSKQLLDWAKTSAPWLVPLLGGIAGGIGADGKPAGTTTTVQDIPERLQPFQMGLINDAKALYDTQKNQTNPLIGQAQGVLSDTIAGRNFIPDTNNPYIGTTTPQVTNAYLGQTTAPVTNPYIGQTTAPASNSYIGQTTSVGANPYLGLNNPYLEGVLSKTLNDVQGRVNAQFGRSGFGGSANQELLARNLADSANQLRYQDYGLQAQLGESDVARRLAAQQADIARNAGLQQQLSTYNTSLGQADLSRNAALQQQLGTYNAGLSQADLARNASLAQNLGQFNAGLFQTDTSRNAGLWGADAARNLQNQQANLQRQQAAATGAPAFAQAATNASYSPYQNYQGILSGWGGGTNTSPYFNNQLGGILSGALAGYGATSLFK